MKDHLVVALAAMIITICSLLAQCGCASAVTACEPRTVDAIGKQYERLALDLIATGACDAHALVEECPAYRLIEEHQDVVLEGLGCQ